MLTRINKHRDEAGFTLIELLVVVIIIGILAAIAIPVFLSQREGAQTASAESDARNVAIAMETWYTTEGSYPTEAQLNASVTAATPGAGANASENNFVRVDVAADGKTYVISACNTSAAEVVWYDSAGGGLTETKPATGLADTACPDTASGDTITLVKAA